MARSPQSEIGKTLPNANRDLVPSSVFSGVQLMTLSGYYASYGGLACDWQARQITADVVTTITPSRYGIEGDGTFLQDRVQSRTGVHLKTTCGVADCSRLNGTRTTQSVRIMLRNGQSCHQS
jgi:hypothetical protein